MGKGALIGSGGDADFVLLDPKISRRHAVITKKHNRYFLTDLKSTNGTFVNGRQVKPENEYPIGGADDVQFGSLHFTFLLRKAPMIRCAAISNARCASRVS